MADLSYKWIFDCISTPTLFKGQLYFSFPIVLTSHWHYLNVMRSAGPCGHLAYSLCINIMALKQHDPLYQTHHQ